MLVRVTPELRDLIRALEAAQKAAQDPEHIRRKEKIERYTLEVAAMYDNPPPAQIEAIRQYLWHTLRYRYGKRTEEEFDQWHARDLERLNQARQKRRLREGKRTLTAIRKHLRDQASSPQPVSETATTTPTS